MSLKILKEGKYLIICKDIISKKTGRLKEKSYKYDLSTGECFNNFGKKINSLHSFLHDVDQDEFISAFEDKNYKEYIYYCFSKQLNGRKFKSASLLEGLRHCNKYADQFKHREQYYAAGFQNLVDDEFIVPLADIPKIILDFVRKWKVKLTEYNINVMKENINIINSLMTIDITTYPEIFLDNIKGGLFSRAGYFETYSKFTQLVTTYKYDPRAMFEYAFKLYRFEGIDISSSFWTELCDYARMMTEMSVRKWDKYPGHFLTIHRITSRNYNQMKTEYNEEEFKAVIQEGYNWTYKNFIFMYPKTTDEIKDEGCQQQNCVASYIKDVIEKRCHIVFMRYKDWSEKSYITIEIKNHVPTQCLRTFNLQPLKDDKVAIEKYKAYLERKFINKKDKDKDKDKDNENVA